jgi:negative regulator of sigma-B (phosphoserine phosphatase)
METMKAPFVESGVAKFILPGEAESGDQHLISPNHDGVLIAAIDGIGHGTEAAGAASVATSVLKASAGVPIISLIERCHHELRHTRGVVISLAYIDVTRGMMTWLGIGNVQGVLMRAGAKKGSVQEVLLLRGGVVGSQLPPLQAAVLPIQPGDTLAFATDGVREEFTESLSALEGPQRAAERILEYYRTGNDDALVLIARVTGTRP